jgi:AraC-like DNA-binding protein
VSNRHALELYRHSFDGVCAISGTQAHRSFYNRVTTYDMAGSLLSFCEGAAHTLSRSLRDTRMTDPDLIMISINHNGIRGADYNNDGGDARAGDIRIADSGRPLVVAFDEFTTTKLMVRRSALPRNLADMDLHGVVLRKDSPSGIILRHHLASMYKLAPYMAPEEALASVEAMIIMMGGGLNVMIGSREDRAQAMLRSVRSRAMDHIERTLLDPGLTPETVARHVGVSRSALYAAFKADGGIWTVIRERRLDAVFDALRRRRSNRPSIQQIAYNHGFGSDTHFSRAFFARFGMRPGEVGDIPAHIVSANADEIPNLTRYLDVWKAA